jgi:Zeta toxin
MAIAARPPGERRGRQRPILTGSPAAASAWKGGYPKGRNRPRCWVRSLVQQCWSASSYSPSLSSSPVAEGGYGAARIAARSQASRCPARSSRVRRGTTSLGKSVVSRDPSCAGGKAGSDNPRLLRDQRSGAGVTFPGRCRSFRRSPSEIGWSRGRPLQITVVVGVSPALPSHDCRQRRRPRSSPVRVAPSHTWQTLPVMPATGTLVVLRGNSGSGKSTVARMLQQRFDRAKCLVVAQDRVRREMLGEREVAGGLNVELIEAIATWGLDRGLIVVLEGILNTHRIDRAGGDLL